MPDYGLRKDGTKKDIGYFGELKRPDGRISTELSMGVNFDGKETEIPTLVPTLTEEEKNYLLSVPEDKIFTANPSVFKVINQKAVEHARQRYKEGKSPFFTSNEKQSPMPDKTVKIEDYMQELEKPQPDIMQEWQASKKPVYDIIMSRYPKPEKQIDPETERKAKFAAQLSDGLTSIGEMFAHGTGARVKSRAGQPTSTGTTNATLKAAADKYEQSMDRYLTADSNAKLQDLNMYMSQAQQERGEKRKMYLYKAEQAAKEKAAAIKRAQDLEDQKTEFENRKKIVEHEARFRPKPKTTETPKFEGLVVNADPSDNSAVPDAMGNKVVPFKMNKQQIANLANTAKNDENFKKEVQNIYIDTVDRYGKPVRGLTNDTNLAQMYAQWKYNQKFKKPEAATPQFDVNKFSFLPKAQPTPSKQGKSKTIKGF